jgi:FkbM family methyltransferase
VLCQASITVAINVTLSDVLNKPEYWFRPLQILRKLRFVTRGHHRDDLIPVRLPWGDILLARATDAIGRSLLTFGVYELAVSEVLWRLADPGDVCLDIGANIGYMTSLLSAKGRVFSFEPHPEIFRRLQKNLESMLQRSRVVATESAVGAADGKISLLEPPDFEGNEGTASIVRSVNSVVDVRATYEVRIQRLDSLFKNSENFGIAKVDVEGAELDVFRGAEILLREKRVRDIVWEDLHSFPSETSVFLSCFGYRIYRFAKSIFGLLICDPASSSHEFHSAPWETSNFLATLDPCRVESRLHARGWRCLNVKR